LTDTQRPGDELGPSWTEFARTRDPGVREALVAQHLGLARKLAQRFTHRGQAYDDLVQVASIGLINAVERFDPDRGVQFSTFATTTIIGELKRHFRDHGWAVRAPRRVQELYLELGGAVERMSHQLGRSPTVPELASHLGTTEEQVLEAMEAGRGYRPASIEATESPDFGGRLASEDELVTLVDQRAELGPALRALAPREREIVRLRFVECLSQSDIAERVGVSQMQVSRLLAASLATLRRTLGDARIADQDGVEPQRPS
jgi:RNA polymerase sigma-B factor